MEQKELTFSQATAEDADDIMEIIDYARRQMMAEGRRQWNEAYPAREHIEADISRGHGYVLREGGAVRAYGAVIFGEEPAYRHIANGRWLSRLPYVVLHRLAVSGEARGRGLAVRFIRAVEGLMRERGTRSFRVDTNHDNAAMRRVLDRTGFTLCGDIEYDRGVRMVYEKLIDEAGPTPDVTIRQVTADKKRYLPLLLLADEQESMIDRYLGRADLFVMLDGEGEAVAVAAVTLEGEGTCELKNLAVAPSLQRRGFGRRMVDYLCRRYGERCHTMLVGTGDSRQTVGFYQSCGFVRSHVVPDFFTLNYDHPIIEEGKPLRDMIYLRRGLRE